MSTTLNELLGEKLIQNNQSDKESNELSTDELHGKYIGLYFSAHWCPPCRNFTPKLSKIFQELNNEIKNKLDIVFISSDEDEQSFNEYFNEMPWKALPFSDRERSQQLGEKFHIEGIPALVVLSPSLETITLDGVDEVRNASDAALHKWSEGKSVFWHREAQDGEYVWEDDYCTECFMKPLIGTRYGCTNRQCRTDLCQTCFEKTNHEHPLIEYLTPKQKYPLEKLLSTVPYLLDPTNEEKIPIQTFLQNDVKSVGFYFSAHWCPPCRVFTPQLAELYKTAQENSEYCHIVFISSDQDEESFNRYRSEMPWPAIPFNSGALLKQYFRITGIPSLIILSSDGDVLARSGRQAIARHGLQALETWGRGEKIARPSPDQYEWSSVTCDGCRMAPLIGQRYYCETCGNYDLCSACEQKGHEHPLVLQPQPNDDED